MQCKLPSMQFKHGIQERKPEGSTRTSPGPSSADNAIDHSPAQLAQRALVQRVFGETAQLERPPQAHPVQRVLIYGGEQFKTKRDLAKSKAAFNAFLDSQDPNKGAKLDHSSKVYTLTDEKTAILPLAEISVSTEKSPEEQRNERGKSKSTEVSLPFRLEDYPKGSTLYAPIDHAVVMINNGPFEFVGTDGLIGCVEVMIECHTELDSGYLVAHVNSHIDSDEGEIRRQLGVMLSALSKELNEEIEWSQFVSGSKTRKLTLVRSANLAEQKLLVNMRNILAESGAHMAVVNSNSVTMQITAKGAQYYDNMREPKPKLDYRSDPDYPKHMLPSDEETD